MFFCRDKEISLTLQKICLWLYSIIVKYMKQINYNTVVEEIRRVATSIKPQNSKVVLFGSRARGDSIPASDWDLLVLVDKPHLSADDYDKYSYPFWELGWKLDEMIHPIVFTVNDWKNKSNFIFKHNIEKEGIVLC